MNKETSLKVLKVCGVIKIVLGIITFVTLGGLTIFAALSENKDASPMAGLLGMLAIFAPLIMILSGAFTFGARKGKGFIFWAVLISAAIDLLAALANLFTGNGADYFTIILEGLTLIACFSLKN